MRYQFLEFWSHQAFIKSYLVSAFDQWRPIAMKYGFIARMDIYNILNVQMIVNCAKELKWVIVMIQWEVYDRVNWLCVVHIMFDRVSMLSCLTFVLEGRCTMQCQFHVGSFKRHSRSCWCYWILWRKHKWHDTLVVSANMHIYHGRHVISSSIGKLGVKKLRVII